MRMKPLCRLAACCAGIDDPDSWDVQVLKQVQVHDPIAFHEVVEQLKSKVFSVSYALLGNASEADVAAQKVFVKMYHTVGCVPQQHDLVKYAYRLAIDQCCVELRLRHLRKLFGWLTGGRSMSDPNGMPATDEKRVQTLVFRGLSKLPEKERALLVLKEVVDQTVEEIADIMDLEPAAVRRRLSAARQRFRTVCD